MKRSNQCAKLALFHVLQLVDEQHQGSPMSAGSVTGRVQQGAQVAVEIAAVCNTGLLLKLHVERHVTETELHRTHESAQRPQRTLCSVAGRCEPVHPQQGSVQRRTQKRGQRTLLRRFQENGDESTTFCIATDPVQQDGFADPAQPHHEHALGREAVADTIKGDRSLFEQPIPTGKFGRRRAGARRVWVPTRIHFN